MVLRNFKYCGDCIKAGTSCFPSFVIEDDKPVKETFCNEAYSKAIVDYDRKKLRKRKVRISLKDTVQKKDVE